MTLKKKISALEEKVRNLTEFKGMKDKEEKEIKNKTNQ